MRRLTELLEQPVRAGFNPPARTVWHCSIRAHPTDRVLSDDQWGHIAAEVVAAVGLAAHGDPRAVRWVAVRHNDDHVHVVATLARQDRRTVWPWQDKRKAQAACRDLEERYGLYRVAPPGTGSRRWPTPAEVNKTARLAARSAQSSGTSAASNRPPDRPGRTGRPATPREQLRRRVRDVAAIATDDRDFFARLHQAGVLVKRRYSSRSPGQVTGYAVGLPGHITGAGTVVFYGGGRLAPDLTLPQLRSRWSGRPDVPLSTGTGTRLSRAGAVPPGMFRYAAGIVLDAAVAMRAASNLAEASAIAYAASDVLSAAAQVWEGRADGPLSVAADALDRAAFDRRNRAPVRRVSSAVHLRSLARLIAIMGVLVRDEDARNALHLIVTLAAIAEHLADLRESQHRLAQARAARAAAAQLRAWTPPEAAAATTPPTHPTPDAGHERHRTPAHDRRSRIR